MQQTEPRPHDPLALPPFNVQVAGPIHRPISSSGALHESYVVSRLVNSGFLMNGSRFRNAISGFKLNGPWPVFWLTGASWRSSISWATSDSAIMSSYHVTYDRHRKKQERLQTLKSSVKRVAREQLVVEQHLAIVLIGIDDQRQKKAGQCDANER